MIATTNTTNTYKMAWRFFSLRHHRDSSSSHSNEALITVHSSKWSEKSDSRVQTSYSRNHANTPRVGFSTIKFRHYNRILGDHPTCDFPLSLGWTYRDSEELNVVDYDEIYHEGQSRYVPAKYLEPTAAQQRQDILTLSGYQRSRLRREERRRRMQILIEWYNHGRIHGDQWLLHSLPENSTLLACRYVCDQPESNCVFGQDLLPSNGCVAMDA